MRVRDAHIHSPVTPVAKAEALEYVRGRRQELDVYHSETAVKGLDAVRFIFAGIARTATIEYGEDLGKGSEMMYPKLWGQTTVFVPPATAIETYKIFVAAGVEGAREEIRVAAGLCNTLPKVTTLISSTVHMVPVYGHYASQAAAYSIAEQMRKVDDGRANAPVVQVVDASRGIQILITADYVFHLVRTKAGGGSKVHVTVFDYNQVLMIQDIAKSRSLVALACALAKTSASNCCRLPSYADVDSMWTWIDMCICEHGNDAYALAKTWDPFTIGCFIAAWDDIPTKGMFLEFMTDTITRLFDELGTSSATRVAFKKCTARLLLLNPQALGEVISLYKTCGFPTVDCLEGIAKLKEVRDGACTDPAELEVMDATCRTAVCHLMVKMALNYYAKHRTWPAVTLNWKGLAVYYARKAAGGSTYLLDAFTKKSHTFDEALLLAEVEDCVYLNWAPMFPANLGTLLYTITPDKAAAPPAEEWTTGFTKAQLGADPPKCSTTKRAIGDMVRGHASTVGVLCQTLIFGSIACCHLGVGLVPKEREMKKESRLYCVLAYPVRVLCGHLEGLIKEYVFKYVPEQTMTMSGADVTRHLYEMTEYSNAEGVWLIFSIDFSKWNNCFTARNTYALSVFLNMLFGVPFLFFFVHIFFSRCFLYLKHSNYPPAPKGAHKNPRRTPPEGPTVIRDWGRGIEGIAQKFWTLMTVCLLYVIGHKLNMRTRHAGQGDDQAVALFVEFPNGCTSKKDLCENHAEYFKLVHDRVLEVMTSVFNKAQLKTKPTETFGTLSTLPYSKQLLYKGAFMGQLLKKVSRIFDMQEGFPPCVYAQLEAIGSTATSAAGSTVYGSIARCIAHIEVLNSILVISRGQAGIDPCEPLRNLVLKRPKDVLGCLMYGGKLAGLPAYPSYYRTLVRGTPNDNIAHIAFLKKAAPIFGEASVAAKCLDLVASGAFLATSAPRWEDDDEASMEVTKTTLLTDPTSLNVRSPALSASKVKIAVKDGLTAAVTEPYLRQMIRLGFANAGRVVTAMLWLLKPIYVVVVSELYAHTVYGVVDRFIGGVTCTGTIRNLVGGGGDADDEDAVDISIEGIAECNQKAIMFLCNTVSFIVNHKVRNPPPACSVDVYKELFNTGWKLPPDDTFGVFAPCPAEQYKFSLISEGSSPPASTWGDSITVVVAPLAGSTELASVHDALWNRGCVDPYVASPTDEGSIPARDKPTKTETEVKDAARIYTIQTGVLGPDELTQDFARRLRLTRHGATDDAISQRAAIPTASCYAHRHRAISLPYRVGLNSLANILTRTIISTDRGNPGPITGDDYPIYFQEVIMYMVSHVVMLLAESPESQKVNLPLTVIATKSCAGCMHPIVTERASLPADVTLPALPVVDSEAPPPEEVNPPVHLPFAMRCADNCVWSAYPGAYQRVKACMIGFDLLFCSHSFLATSRASTYAGTRFKVTLACISKVEGSVLIRGLAVAWVAEHAYGIVRLIANAIRDGVEWSRYVVCAFHDEPEAVWARLGTLLAHASLANYVHEAGLCPAVVDRTSVPNYTHALKDKIAEAVVLVLRNPITLLTHYKLVTTTMGAKLGLGICAKILEAVVLCRIARAIGADADAVKRLLNGHVRTLCQVSLGIEAQRGAYEHYTAPIAQVIGDAGFETWVRTVLSYFSYTRVPPSAWYGGERGLIDAATPCTARAYEFTRAPGVHLDAPVALAVFECDTEQIVRGGIAAPATAFPPDVGKYRVDQAYRGHGISSSAHYKLVEMLFRAGVQDQVVGGRAACLAEGAGSFVVALKSTFGMSEVYYSTLVDLRVAEPHRVGSSHPAACIEACVHSDNRDDLWLMGFTDVTCPTILSTLRERQLDLDLVTIDYPDLTLGIDRFRYFANAARIADVTLKAGGSLILKIHMQPDAICTAAIAVMKLRFKRVVVATMTYSSFEGFESYMACVGYQPNPISSVSNDCTDYTCGQITAQVNAYCTARAAARTSAPYQLTRPNTVASLNALTAGAATVGGVPTSCFAKNGAHAFKSLFKCVQVTADADEMGAAIETMARSACIMSADHADKQFLIAPPVGATRASGVGVQHKVKDIALRCLAASVAKDIISARHVEYLADASEIYPWTSLHQIAGTVHRRGPGTGGHHKVHKVEYTSGSIVSFPTRGSTEVQYAFAATYGEIFTAYGKLIGKAVGNFIPS